MVTSCLQHGTNSSASSLVQNPVARIDGDSRFESANCVPVVVVAAAAEPVAADLDSSVCGLVNYSWMEDSHRCTRTGRTFYREVSLVKDLLF